jgi:CTP synthase (UTP-ammonia lyase)
MPPALKIGIIGDFNPSAHAHIATNAALVHAADALGLGVDVQWLSTLALAAQPPEELRGFDALWCAPHSPYQSMAGALAAIRFAREAQKPFIAT